MTSPETPPRVRAFSDRFWGSRDESQMQAGLPGGGR